MKENEDVPIDSRTGLDLEEPNLYAHEFLTDFFGQCISGDGKDVRVLMPLCGKSFGDIKWLYNEGYCVYGVDASETALKNFFTTCNMKYSYTPPSSEGFGLFKNLDGKINLFCGDFFRFSKDVTGGSFFDVVWDRGAFMTISVRSRDEYINILSKCLLPTGRILLAVFTYDTSKMKGPPFAISSDEIHRRFDKKFHVNSLGSLKDSFQTWHQRTWGIDWLKENGYMLSPKI